ncbi:3-phosphoshikimate 1-carboxyvinyltransferase [Halosquirtibacter xylanolyticus]|uniref:3-phosphoshikimate 1-carboxyvinyltransferase n=1 Tax=Halosquirtibacter xylanolyticus TaxID=3374599 RepID=UPI003749D652|nr:3-phosphoshikimate 1-carboxyvinyltransferase [Prolixibacteraceae bacterium]
MKFKIDKTDKNLLGTVTLPASKSICNRALIINALSSTPIEIENISESDDTKVMLKALTFENNTVDIGHAGTAMRFLTAFFSQKEGEWIMTGSQRMKQRPIGVLVDALRDMGADISYMEKEGYPPLQINGKKLKGGELSLDGSVSSQYISAILMLAPTLSEGIELTLTNRVISRSYIELTLNMMKHFGVDSTFEGNTVKISPQTYQAEEFLCESDWTGASYIYQIAALCENVDLTLPYLFKNSLQGDCAIIEWFEKFGVTTTETEKGLKLQKQGGFTENKLVLDFILNPDVAQTMAVLCGLLNIPFHFTGLETLKIKETDRIHALQVECGKMGMILTEPVEGALAWDGTWDEDKKQDPCTFDTYKDHRMAMAYAAVGMFKHPIYINEPMVVTKSFPRFWDDMKNIGFTVENVTV